MLLAENRLKTEKDFATVLRYGRSFFSRFLKIKIKANPSLPRLASSKAGSPARFGFVIGLKFSKKAVVRNRLRRQLSEVVRLEIKEKRIKSGFDAIFFVQQDILLLNSAQLKAELLTLLRKARLLYD